jgi:hypothetical protein
MTVNAQHAAFGDGGLLALMLAARLVRGPVGKKGVRFRQGLGFLVWVRV